MVAIEFIDTHVVDLVVEFEILPFKLLIHFMGKYFMHSRIQPPKNESQRGTCPKGSDLEDRI